MSTAIGVVESMYQAMADGDSDTVMRLLAPDIEWTEAAGFPYGGTYVGPAAVAENVFARLGAEWVDFRAVPDQIVGDGDQVIARGWYSGRYRATDKSFRARYVHWFEVSDSRIRRFEQITDTAQITPVLA